MRKIIKKTINRTPILGGVVKRAYSRMAGEKMPVPFSGSAAYWEERYAVGGDSGVGSYGMFAEFKAEVLNEFVATHHLRTVIEFGCGDGNQLGLAEYPEYVGFDVSSKAISKCEEVFGADPHKSFRLMKDYNGEVANLVLSLDVIYHLVEDDIFENYMRVLFGASDRYVIIYSSDSNDSRRPTGPHHVRHRKFTTWVSENLYSWKLMRHLPNRYPYQGDYRQGSFAEFFIYERV